MPNMKYQFHLLYAVYCFIINGASADINNLNNDGIYSECIKNGHFAITFDDGPSSNTDAVLDVLKAKGVHATFFLNGDNFENVNVETTRNKIRRIIQEGHQIGSHTWSHADLTANLSSDAIRNEMLDLESKVEEILGFKMSIMRPPYGRFNDTVIDIIHGELNYSVVMWSLDTVDWENLANWNVSFQAYIDTMEYATNLNSSFIALHHDFADGSAELAAHAIDYVLDKGFRLVRISECLGIPDDNSSGVNCSVGHSMYLILWLCIFILIKI